MNDLLSVEPKIMDFKDWYGTYSDIFTAEWTIDNAFRVRMFLLCF